MVGNRIFISFALLVAAGFNCKRQTFKALHYGRGYLFPHCGTPINMGNPHPQQRINQNVDDFMGGISFSLVQILVMPYILLNGSKDHEMESIALFFSAGNLTTIVAGLFSYLLPLMSKLFTTEILLILYSVLGFIGVYYVRKLPKQGKPRQPKFLSQICTPITIGIKFCRLQYQLLSLRLEPASLFPSSTYSSKMCMAWGLLIFH